MADRAPSRALADCVCGASMRVCVTCAMPRCLQCDPYRSDDCLRELAAADRLPAR